MTYKKVVIIGAPRSGTNMLRDALCALPGVATWPCDEINYLWRVGNVDFPTDELPSSLVTLKAKNRIGKAFDWVAKKYGADVVVEKTCANSLRIPFVERVLDDPLYVYIVRDGVDASVSAAERWTGEIDYRYLLKKMRFVPRADLPRYATRFVRARMARGSSSDRRVATWGPKFEGLEAVAGVETTLQLAARQWKACVDAADRDFAQIDERRIATLKYEEFVARPAAHLQVLANWIGATGTDVDIANAVRGVTTASVGRGRAALSRQQLESVEAIVGGD